MTLLSASTAEQGLETLRTAWPDVILMDRNLSGMGGVEALGMLREDDRLRSIPVIAVSADAISQDVEAALAAGFTGYVTKPIEIGKLLAVIDGVLKSSAEVIS